MEAACNVTAELDVIVAMAHAAAMAPIEYTRPVMKDAVSTHSNTTYYCFHVSIGSSAE
jgi:DNA mismatch repair ATPase MutS